MTERPCCKIDCSAPAEWELYCEGCPKKRREPLTDCHTAACTDHIGALLCDAPEHHISAITATTP